MVIYIDNPKKFTPKLLELMVEYNMFVKEVNIKKNQLHFYLPKEYGVFLKILFMIIIKIYGFRNKPNKKISGYIVYISV